MKNKILKYFYVLTLLFSLLFTMGFGSISSEAATRIVVGGNGDCNTDSGNTGTSTMDELRQALNSGSSCNTNTGIQYKVVNGNDVDADTINSIIQSRNNGGVQSKAITKRSCNTDTTCNVDTNCNTNECSTGINCDTRDCDANTNCNESTNCDVNTNNTANVKTNGSTTEKNNATQTKVVDSKVEEVINSAADSVKNTNTSSNCSISNISPKCSAIVLGSSVDSRCNSYLQNAIGNNYSQVTNCNNIASNVLCWSSGRYILCNDFNKSEELYPSEEKDTSTEAATEDAAEQTTEETNIPATNDAAISKAKECFDLINAERRSLGVAELVWDDTLYGFCGTRVGEIRTSFSHTRPNGTSWNTVMGSAYPNIYSAGGECLLTGANNAGETFNGWKGSSGHYEILKSANYNRGAVATDGTNWVFIAAKAK